MESYEKAMQAMEALFARDCQFALATAKQNTPSVRYVDTYWDRDCFYIVTYGKSRKALEIAENTNVSLCNSRLSTFTGKAYNIGHPLKPENREIRQKLTEVFKAWYFRHNNEADEAMCYLRIVPESGFFHRDETGFQIDFLQRTATEFPFAFETILTEE
ncbi:MAG: pyridoxamine 5'-phosphate oxidase family protein [Eubacteriales bacterium]|nr:pyridoxamine 5'-phosphate oxidase family protein [Eubacteriales bacterium]